MMTTLLPQDSNDNPIPALRLKSGGAHKISFSATSDTNSTGFKDDTQIISLYSNQAVYIAFGEDNTVTATDTDHFIPAGIYYDIAIGGGSSTHYKYIAALQADEAGILYISEKE